MPIGQGFSYDPYLENPYPGAQVPTQAGGSILQDIGAFLGGAIQPFLNQTPRQGAPPVANIFTAPAFSGFDLNLGGPTGINLSSGPNVATASGGCTTPFRTGNASNVVAQDFWITGPDGKCRLFGPKGRIILTSSDVAASKKVKRVAAQMNRVCGTRRRVR